MKMWQSITDVKLRIEAVCWAVVWSVQGFSTAVPWGSWWWKLVMLFVFRFCILVIIFFNHKGTKDTKGRIDKEG